MDRTREALSLLLAEGSEVVVTLRGDSMVPSIRPGTRVGLEACAGRLRVGQVVVASNCGEPLIAHRVVGVDGDTVWTRGDGCPAADPPLRRNDVIGTVSRIEIGGRFRPVPTLPLAVRLRRIVQMFSSRLRGTGDRT